MNVVRELITVLGFSVNDRGVKQYERRIEQIPGNIRPVINQIRNLFAGAVAGFSAALVAREFIKAGDEFLAMRARVASGLNESAERTGEFLERIYNLSRQTGTAMEAGATAFARFAGAARQSGRSYEEAFDLVETLQKSFILNGTSQSEAASVVMQVGQALSKGVFNDDEFKSFMENAGPLAEEFAKALGKTVPELRAMSTAGKLTTDIVFPALIRAGTRFRQNFDQMPMTARRAFDILKVTTTRFLADINLGINASLTLGRAIKTVGDNIEWLRTKLPVIGEFISNQVGLQNILEFVGVTLALVYGPSLLRMLTLATTAALRFAFTAGLPALGFTLLALAIQDVITYFRGGESVVGNFMKQLDPRIIQMHKDAWQNIRENIEASVAAIGNFIDRLNNLTSLDIRQWLSRNGWTFRGPDGEIVSPERFGELRSQQSGQPTAPSGPSGVRSRLAEFFRSFGRSQSNNPAFAPNASGMPTVGNLSPTAGNQTLYINPNITQEFNITAPGADGASLTASVGRAARDGAENVFRFGNDLARDLLRANPMTEAGAR